MSAGNRTPAAQARPIVDHMIALLAPFCEWIEVGGSLRRKRETVGDVELVLIPGEGYLAELDRLVLEGTIQKGASWGQKQRKFFYEGLQFDCYTCDVWNRGYQFWIRTGSNGEQQAAERVLSYMKRANAPFRSGNGKKEQGYLWTLSGEKLRINTEADLFELWGIPFIAPEDRSVESFQKAFKVRGHLWGEPPKFIPVIEQTLLPGMTLENSTYRQDIDAAQQRSEEARVEFGRMMRYLRGDSISDDLQFLKGLREVHDQAIKANSFSQQYHAERLVKIDQLIVRLSASRKAA